MDPKPSAIDLEVARLILAQRWAAVATLGNDGPLASMVAYAVEPGLSALLFYLSGLAAHTRHLIAEPRASVAITAADPGRGDPHTLPRVSVQGRAAWLDRGEAAFEDSWRVYVSRFPDAEARLGLGDFVLFRFAIEEARYVGGFARAATIGADRLHVAAGELEG